MSVEVWAFVPDLMDQSRISAVVGGVRFVVSPSALTGAPEGATVVVDLGRPGVLEVLSTLAGRRCIGFGSHVDRVVLAAAEAAGCDVVVARSEFFRRAAALLT